MQWLHPPHEFFPFFSPLCSLSLLRPIAALIPGAEEETSEVLGCFSTSWGRKGFKQQGDEIGCSVLWGLPLCLWCPSLYVVHKQYMLCITRWKTATVLYSSPPLSLPALLDPHMCRSKGPLHPLFESDAIVMHGILCTEDIIGGLPFDLQQLQRYRTFHLP